MGLFGGDKGNETEQPVDWQTTHVASYSYKLYSGMRTDYVSIDILYGGMSELIVAPVLSKK